MSDEHAEQVARKDFSLSFRGFDQNEVRAHLAEVAGELAMWRARVDELQERVAELEAEPPPAVDEEALERALGREATRIIHAARGAAVDIHARAEAESAATIADAEATAMSLREVAEQRAAAVRVEAAAEAEVVVAAAMSERDRVLDELAMRRAALVAELERLHEAHARLADAFARARGALDSVAGELANADASASALRTAPAPGPMKPPPPRIEPEPEPLEQPASSLRLEPEPEAVPDPPVEPEERRSSSLKLVRRGDDARGTPVAPAAEDPVESVRIIRPEPEPEPEREAPADDEQPAEDGAVDGLFARLRADRAEKVAHAETVLAQRVAAATPDADSDMTDDVQPPVGEQPAAVEPDHALLATRDESLASDERSLVRALKRALADEQNEVLDGLRRLKGAPTAAALLPDRAAHDARLEAVLGAGVAAAAASGGSAVGGDGGRASGVAADLARSVVADLRARVERAIEEAGGDVETLAEAISSAYRGWKTGRTEALARDAITSGFAAGMYTATHGPLLWVVDPAEGGCPDCDDNALAGPTAKGSAFPTGQLHPPAHAGCQCIVVAAT